MDGLDHPLMLRCGVRLANRIAMAPLTNTQSEPDGTLGDDEYRWLLRRAEGGFGWISTCAAYVSEEGKAWMGQLGVSSNAHLPGLTRLAAALKATGSTAVVQLYHGGAKAGLAPGRPLSTSDGGPAGTRAASPEDLERVVGDFVSAADRTRRAGFDGVEIHGANGYLFTQFLAPADNPRTDAYGGDLEGRSRLLRETAQAVRAAVPADFAVGVRLSPVDLYDVHGLILSDSVQVGRWLVDDGIDFIHLSLRDAAASPPHEPEAGAVARAFRDALPASVPIFAAGGIWTRADADRALAVGVDVIALGRASIAHPDWPTVSPLPDWRPVRPPWDPPYLTGVAVGAAFLRYLERFPGVLK